jgi:AraC-like DNA-binding protein
MGTYLRNRSQISGVNAGTAAIIMPVEGTVDFQVMDGSYLCGPLTPFLLEANEDFHATLSEDTHLLIIQLSLIKRSGYRPAFRRQQAWLSELFTSFLYATPFFRDHKDAKSHLEDFSAQLYEIMGGNHSMSLSLKKPKRVGDERRLCNAIQLLNTELGTYIDIESIASRSGLSLRNLHYLMKQYTGQSPYQYLRGRRLIKAREAIIKDYPQKISIAQQALKIGFQHAERFSAYYYKHFDEYPNETLGALNHLEQMSKYVKSIADETGNISQYWLTSSTAPQETR